MTWEDAAVERTAEYFRKHPAEVGRFQELLIALGYTVLSQATADHMHDICRRLDAGIDVSHDEVSSCLYAVAACSPDYQFGELA